MLIFLNKFMMSVQFLLQFVIMFLQPLMASQRVLIPIIPDKRMGRDVI